MLLVDALKTVCDLLFCFSFAALFSAFADARLLMGVILALGFLSSLILQKSGGTLWARLVCGLLPALGLFAAQSEKQALIAAVVLAFYFVLTISGRSRIHYEDYKYWFGFPAVPAAVLFVVCATQWPIHPAATVCSALYLFLGVLVMRRKRMGSGAPLKLRALNLAELVGVVVFGVLAFVLLFEALKFSEKALEILMLPFAWLFQGLVYLFELFGNLLVSMQPEATPAPSPTASVTPSPLPESGNALPDPGSEAAYAWVAVLGKIVLILLVLAILAGLLRLFFKMLQKLRPKAADDAEAFEEGEAEPLRFGRAKRKKRKKSYAPSNREKIRRIYREYLLLMRNSGIEIARQTTSEDVMTASGTLAAPGEAERMRELYIRARYDDTEEPGDEELRQAEALLAAIRERAKAETDGRPPAAKEDAP